MDPLTQGVLGAAASQAFSGKSNLYRWSCFGVGLFAGMAPDLDILIDSKADPLVYFEFHRQFTHSLIFIPCGALIVAGLFYGILSRVFKKQMSFKALYIFAFLGYATHGLLDSCTSYGTQLFWPFSDYRVAWDVLPIIDPLFSLILVLGVGLSLIKKKAVFAQAALALCVFYVGLSEVQKHRVTSIHDAHLKVSRLKDSEMLRREVKPTIFNIFLWKVITETENYYHVDAIWTLPGFGVKIYEGESTQKLNIARDFPKLKKKSTQYKDIQRFSWFSDGFLSLHPEYPNVIGDARYSMVPTNFSPLWGIEIDQENQNQHIKRREFRRTNTEMNQAYIKMMKGQDL